MGGPAACISEDNRPPCNSLGGCATIGPHKGPKGTYPMTLKRLTTRVDGPGFPALGVAGSP